jgi:hypothetical protein
VGVPLMLEACSTPSSQAKTFLFKELQTIMESQIMQEPEAMIGVAQLTEIIETAIMTGHITGAIPVSLMLVGPSGAGKSKMVMQYHHSAGCHVTTDVTSMGLQELLTRDIEGKIRFIIIPDFNIVLSHRASTLQLTIANLLSMLSEGIIRIDDGRAVKETKHNPIGMISAMTSQMYAMIGKKWIALGFSRRFLPINYDYGLPTREKIQFSIADGLTGMLQLVERKLPKRDHVDVAIPNEFGRRLMNYSSELATNIGYIPAKVRGNSGRFQNKAVFVGKLVEFSPHIVLRTMAQAHALMEDRREVNEDDMVFCMKLISFTRFDQPVLL